MVDKYYKCQLCKNFFKANKGSKYCSLRCRNATYYQSRKSRTIGTIVGYSRMHPTCMQHASEYDIQEFCNRFHEEDGHWLWHGSVNPVGHGQWHPHSGHLMNHAHRASYELFKGNIPEGLVIDHLCKIRQCVNPEHLEAVTQRVNLSRGLHNNKPKQ